MGEPILDPLTGDPSSELAARIARLEQRQQIMPPAYVEQRVPQRILVATWTALTGLSGSITVGSRRLVRLTAWTSGRILIGGGTIGTRIVEGATVVAGPGGTTIQNAGDVLDTTCSAIITPTQGTHTYAVESKVTTGDCWTPVDNWAGMQPFNYLFIEDLGLAP